MAERRMFSKSIIDSDVFLDMPLTTQALYFHLSMRADDEGFINNPKKIMRMIGASQDELNILLAKRYILGFESGVIVIKHWRIHNYIQKDRMKETLYKEERNQITMKDDKNYTEKKNNGFVHEKALITANSANDITLDTNCVQDGDIGKVSIGENSIGKVIKEKNNKKEISYFDCETLPYFFDDDFNSAWIEFMKNRKKAKHTEYSMHLLFKILEGKSKQEALDIVNKSIVSGWTGLFENKFSNFKPSNNPDKFQGEANFEIK